MPECKINVIWECHLDNYNNLQILVIYIQKKKTNFKTFLESYIMGLSTTKKKI